MNKMITQLIEKKEVEDTYENYAELRKECRRRGIDVKGKDVHQLHQLLKDDDEKLNEYTFTKGEWAK